MKIAALTDIGSCRQENQDNYCARQLVDGTGWGLVCDGMGGANGGSLPPLPPKPCCAILTIPYARLKTAKKKPL